MGWSDEEFLAEVQRRFGFRLGRFLKVGRRRRVSLVVEPCASAPARAAASSSAMPRKGCIRSPAWASTWGCATSRAWPSSSPSTARRARRGTRRPTMPGAPRIGARSSPSPTGWCACSPSPWGPVQRLRNLGLLAFDLLPPAKAALSSLSHRRCRAHSKARARRADRREPLDEPRLRRRGRRRAAPSAPSWRRCCWRAGSRAPGRVASSTIAPAGGRPRATGAARTGTCACSP